MNHMSNTRKMATASVLVAAGVASSGFYIPVGVAKCFPVQHMINVVAGVMLGPLYAVMMAWITSMIRVILGTGSLLAFPGSMCGALLCAVLYKRYGTLIAAFLGEILGTGVIGALLAWPVAAFLLSKKVALFAFVIPFGISTLAGGIFAVILIHGLQRTGIFHSILADGGKHHDL